MSSPNEIVMPLSEENPPVPCNLCGSNGYAAIWQEGLFRVVQCDTCHLTFLNPTPVPGELEGLYSADYFREYYLKHQSRRLAYFDARVRELAAFTTTDRLLDVGCGPGYFLAAAKKAGWTVKGIDTSAFAVEHARREYRLDVDQGSLDEYSFERSFDVVTMWDVIAHLPSPSAYVKLAHQALRPGGILVIQTPFRSRQLFTAARVLSRWGKGRSLLHVPAQIYHFTPQTLGRLLEKCGFEPISRNPVQEVALPLQAGDSLRLIAAKLSQKALVSLRWYHSMIAYGKKI